MKYWVGLFLVLLPLAAWARPQSLLVLSRAGTLDDSVVGEAGTASSLYAAYATASDDLWQIDKNDLLWLREQGTPAGRLYGAMLLRQAGMPEPFGPLAGDAAALKFRTGCEVMPCHVSEVVGALAKHGNYLGFTGQVLAHWRRWKTGRWLAVSFEDRLYRAGPDFYLRVALENLTDHSLAVDLQRKTLYPNQWGGHSKPKRDVIDERRPSLEPAPPLPEFQTWIPARKKFTYFVRFNGPSGAAAVDAVKEKFVVVSVDGQVWATDGKGTESVGRLPSEFAETDIAFPAPVRWKTLPPDARLAPER